MKSIGIPIVADMSSATTTTRKELTMNVVAIFETRYFKPTDKKGSRIRVKSLSKGKYSYIPYDHELSTSANHWQSVCIMLERYEIRNTSMSHEQTRNGWISVVYYKEN